MIGQLLPRPEKPKNPEKARDRDTEFSPEAAKQEIKDKNLLKLRERFLANRTMYQLPGDPPVTDTDIQKYLASNEKFIQILPELIEAELKKWPGIYDPKVAMIAHAPEAKQGPLQDKLAALIKKELENSNPYTRLKAAQLIPYVSKTQQKSLQGKVLSEIKKSMKGAASDRERVVELIPYAPEETRTPFIERGLSDEDHYTRSLAMQMARYAPEKDRAVLIDRGLEDKGFQVRYHAVNMIKYAPKEVRASLLEKALKNETLDIRFKAVELLSHTSISEPVRIALLEQALKDKSQYISGRAEAILQNTSTKPPKLDKSIDDSYWREHAAKTPLYKYAPKRFLKHHFSKTGSKTNLLDLVPGQPDNTLKEKVIIREIDIPQYLSWKQAFEAADFWREQGFDYVPIEPIVKVSAMTELNHPAGAKVFTRVLNGPAVGSWMRNFRFFADEILGQVQRIKNGLETLGIEHGHPHNDNFVLYFNRAKDGKPDLSQPPRVYVIDFDAAASPSPSPQF